MSKKEKISKGEEEEVEEEEEQEEENQEEEIEEESEPTIANEIETNNTFIISLQLIKIFENIKYSDYDSVIIDFLKNLFSSKDVSEIGEVDVSRSVKDYWVNQPSKYKFKLENNSDTLKCSYSIDWGNNFISFQFNGNSRSLNEVVKYTYSLFTKMGLMSQFRIRGEAAINKINESGFLAHH